MQLAHKEFGKLQTHSISWQLPALLKNSRVFSTTTARLLIPDEHFSAQCADVWNVTGASVFAEALRSNSIPDRVKTRLAGSGFHLGHIGTIIIWILANVEKITNEKRMCPESDSRCVKKQRQRCE